MSNFATKRNCPSCKSIEAVRSRHRSAIERYLLRTLGVRPFRCLSCNARFYAFVRFDEETSVNNKAA
jgi:hypothetical protein